jgi:hypothetical protein
MDPAKVKSINPEEGVVRFVEKMKEVEERDKQGNVIMEDKEDANGNVVRAPKMVMAKTLEKVVNEDNTEFKLMSLLNKSAAGTPEAVRAHDDFIAVAREAGQDEDQKTLDFDTSSLYKSIARGMEGADLAKLQADSTLFTGIAEQLSMAQLKSLAEEGGVEHLTSAVKAKGNAYPDNPVKQEAERKRLLASPVTRHVARQMFKSQNDDLRDLNRELSDLEQELVQTEKDIATAKKTTDAELKDELHKKAKDLKDGIRGIKSKIKAERGSDARASSKDEANKAERAENIRDLGGKPSPEGGSQDEINKAERAENIRDLGGKGEE